MPKYKRGKYNISDSDRVYTKKYCGITKAQYEKIKLISKVNKVSQSAIIRQFLDLGIEFYDEGIVRFSDI